MTARLDAAALIAIAAADAPRNEFAEALCFQFPPVVSVEALFVTDLEGRLLHWGAEAEALYGWPAAAAAGQPVAPRLHPHDAAAWSLAFGAARRDGAWAGVLRQRTAAGQSLEVRCRMLRVETRPGGGCVVVTAVDRRADQRLRDLTAEAERARMLLALVGATAHSMNNNLQLVRMAVALLRGADQGDAAAAVDDAAAQCAALLQQLQHLARGVRGERGVVVVPQVVHAAAELARESLERAGGVLASYPPRLPAARGSALDLFQLIMALLDAAAPRLAPGSKVELAAASDGGEVEVSASLVEEGDEAPPSSAAEVLARANGWRLASERGEGGRRTWRILMPIGPPDAAGR